MVSDMHRAARTLAAKGLAVLPCVVAGKEPAIRNGSLGATTDPATIDQWWTLDPNFNVAVATGSTSGIFVVDIDGEDGERSLAELEQRHGSPLPPTVEVITGRGRHCYFRLGDGDPIRNSAGRIGQGIDTRGDGGFVLAPPSLHPSGRRYAWSCDAASDFADPPDWLMAALADTGEGTARPVEEWRAVAGGTVPEGKRNDTLARLSGHLLRHFVDPYVTVDLMRAFNFMRCVPPLSDDEVVAVVNSVAKREATRRAMFNGNK